MVWKISGMAPLPTALDHADIIPPRAQARKATHFLKWTIAANQPHKTLTDHTQHEHSRDPPETQKPKAKSQKDEGLKS